MLKDRCFRIHLKGTRCKQTPPATKEPSTNPRTTNQQQAMIVTQNMAYNRPPPLLTLPTQHTTDTHTAPSPTHYHTNPLRNISLPMRPPVHCTIITHHSILSPIQPTHPQVLFNPFILLKHFPKHSILLFPGSSSHLNTQDGIPNPGRYFMIGRFF